MLTLVLLRHAKAEPLGRGDDFDRALTDTGKADARRFGAYLANARYQPALALVSASKRTTQTYKGVTRAFPTPIPVRFEDKFYNATASEMREALKGIPEAVDSLMIVGHNPGIMDAAMTLIRDGDHAEVMRLRNRFPPCAAAILTFSSETWGDAMASGGRLDAFLLPEDLLPKHLAR